MKLTTTPLALIAFAGAVCASSAAGGTSYVPQDYPTIQDAIDAASDGDRIEVAPGVYSENINFDGKRIELVAMWGSSTTVILGTAVDQPTVRLAAPSDGGAEIRGFTISGGLGINGGGLFVTGEALIAECRVIANTGDLGGGAFIAGDAIIRDSRFLDNAADMGGAIYVGPVGSLTLEGSTVENNVAVHGGGLYAGPLAFAGDSSTVRIASSSFASNSADAGGAVFAVMREMEIVSSTFSGNYASADGGGVYVMEADAQIEDSEFADNGAGGFGGGLRGVEGGLISVTSSTFDSNSAGQNGSAFSMGSAGELVLADVEMCGNSIDTIDGDWTDAGGARFECDDDAGCPGDVAAPFGVVSIADLTTVISALGSGGEAGDADGDGTTTVADLSMVLANFGESCGN